MDQRNPVHPRPVDRHQGQTASPALVQTNATIGPPAVLVDRGAELLAEGLALAATFNAWARRLLDFEGAVSVLAPTLDSAPPDVIDDRDDRWEHLSHLRAMRDVRGWIGYLAIEPSGTPNPEVFDKPLAVLERRIAKHGTLVTEPARLALIDDAGASPRGK